MIAAVLAGCSATGHAASSTSTPPPATTGSISASASAPQPAGSVAATPAPPPVTASALPPTSAAAPSSSSAPPAAAPAFTATTSAVTATDLGASWRAGCPVGPAQLRQITLDYWGFDDAPHVGRIVVNAAVVPAVTKVFASLYAQRFPIRSMRPTSEFGGSDDASMAADNTSGFNCRYAVATGTPRWSVHAYGEAIDVNTIENPYLEGGQVLPPAGAPYAKRSPYRPGMAVPGGVLVKAFAAVGWQWGGRWTATPDYQHFSATGG